MSAALEPGTTSLSARLARIAEHSGGRPRYTVLGDVAQGGMGTILRAWDELLSREVAMKVVTHAPGSDAGEEERAEHDRRLTRFVDEARITAQLDHPGIVPVYEIGLAPDGSVFFTMPLVRGRDLKHVFELVALGTEGWTLQRALDVMHKVCLTVAFAHSKGVVHRDLKPENVMVGPYGETYVMDWGLALLVGRADRAGIVGTPAYMPPEQARGRSHEVSARSDVYSLGAMLYELFARRVPHALSLETRGDSPLEDVLAEPPRPLAELVPDAPPELCAIAAKAMAAKPAERYGGALEMAEDLARWLAGRSVSALQSSRWTRLLRWRARNRALALALDALVALGLAAGLGFVLQQRTLMRAVRAKHAEALLGGYAAGLSAADLGLRAHEITESRRRLAACAPELRGWEWRHLALRADSSVRGLPGHANPVRAVAVSPDGRIIASGADDGRLVLTDAATGATLAVLAGHGSTVTAVAFALVETGGLRLASAARDKTVRVWDAETGAPERVLAAHAADVVALALSPDGRVLASGDLGGTLVLTELATGATLARADGSRRDTPVAVDFLADGELAVAYLSGLVRVHGPDLAVLRSTRAGKKTPSALDAAPDGCVLAVSVEGDALLLDAATLAPVRVLGGHASPVGALAFSPDGTTLATGGFDNVVRVREVASGRLLGELVGHENDVNAIAFLPDGRQLVTGAEDATLRLWDLARAPVLALQAADWVNALAFAPDGGTLAAGGRDRALSRFDARTGELLSSEPVVGIVDALATTADGELVLACGGTPLVEDRRSGAWRALAPRPDAPRMLVADPARGLVWSRDLAGTVRADALSGAAEPRVLELGGDSTSLALGPDGTLLAAGTVAGEVLVLTAEDLVPRARCEGGGAVLALAFAPNGRRLAAARRTGAITLHSGPGWGVERTLTGHENFVSCVAWTPDGARLVSGSYDHTVRVWSPDGVEALLTLRGHGAAVTAVAFDRSGEVLASASKDATVRLWRTDRCFAPRATDAARDPQ